MAEIVWLGGWASDLACWRGALESLYPGRTHRFLDAHAVLDGAADLRGEAGRLPPEGCLAAWSLGSLLVHRELAAGWSPACRMLSLSPIFDFCRPDGPWPRAAVTRMIRRLPRERGKVLEEFRAAAWGNSRITPGMAAAWEERVRAYADGSLARGLEALAGISLDRGRVPASPARIFLASPEDPLAPAPSDTAWAADAYTDPYTDAYADAGRAWRLYPRGHLPFLDFPDLVAPLLPAPEGAA